MSQPQLLTIRVGMPRTMVEERGIDELAKEWTSGIFKDLVSGPVWLGRTDLVGDGQADLKAHGGPDKAVLCYAASHYPDWRVSLNRPDLAWGSFGENFTIDGLAEPTVCIGDQYEIGEALVEVSQPRLPCWKLSRRNGIADLALQVQNTGRGGWYLRVLREGHVEAGQPVVRVERLYPEWTITRVYDLVYRREINPDASAALAGCPALADRCRTILNNAQRSKVA
jgi:MOSC domain-containing protein YiiM